MNDCSIHVGGRVHVSDSVSHIRSPHFKYIFQNPSFPFECLAFLCPGLAKFQTCLTQQFESYYAQLLGCLELIGEPKAGAADCR